MLPLPSPKVGISPSTGRGEMGTLGNLIRFSTMLQTEGNTMTERQLTPDVEAREQFGRAEQALQSGLYLWNDTARATTDLTVDMVEQYLQCSEKVVESYRVLYQHGFNAWTQYLQQVNESVDRVISGSGYGRR